MRRSRSACRTRQGFDYGLRPMLVCPVNRIQSLPAPLSDEEIDSLGSGDIIYADRYPLSPRILKWKARRSAVFCPKVPRVTRVTSSLGQLTQSWVSCNHKTEPQNRRYAMRARLFSHIPWIPADFKARIAILRPLGNQLSGAPRSALQPARPGRAEIWCDRPVPTPTGPFQIGLALAGSCGKRPFAKPALQQRGCTRRRWVSRPEDGCRG